MLLRNMFSQFTRHISLKKLPIDYILSTETRNSCLNALLIIDICHKKRVSKSKLGLTFLLVPRFRRPSAAQ